MIEAIRRLLNRGRRIPFVYHPDYRRELVGIPLDAMRGERILAFLLEGRLISPRQVNLPRAGSWENLRRVHSVEYLRSLEDPAVVGQVLGIPISAEGARAAVELQRLAVGGTIQATRLARRRSGPVVHLGGGFHHAGPDRGTGFCLLNDVAVAVARLRARGVTAPVLVVDLDIHDGNGTRAAFSTDPTVHTYSLHNQTWDEVEAVADTCIELGSGVDDAEYLDVLRSTLPEVVRTLEPEFVFYIAGADVSASDGFGDAALTPGGILERDRFVMEECWKGPLGRKLPAVILLGGGYGSAAWRPPARFCGWLVSGREMEPPDDLTTALDRARWLKRMGEGEEGARSDSPEPFFSLSEDDLGAVGGAAAGGDLLLGRYSLLEVQAQLERFGILPQVRARGYPSPVVEIVPSTGFGPTVRVFGEPEREALLMEVRLDLDRATTPSMTLLGVEWLLLQDPKRRFPEWRPPLPGQESPGLGSLADVVAWLMTLCHDLGLDGLGFRSSHFYIAALARRHLRFLRTGDEARYRVIRAATDGKSLSEASRMVERGDVVDPSTGEVLRWMDVPMVVPLSRRMKELLGGHAAQNAEPPRSPEAPRG